MERESAEFNLFLPQGFFDSPQGNMTSVSPSEALALAMLWHIIGVNADEIKKGDPSNKEPDCIISSGEGIEVVWAEDNTIMRILDGSISPDGQSRLYGTVEEAIKKQIDRKFEKLNRGYYSGASKVSLFCLLVTSLPLWYCADEEYSGYSDLSGVDALVICERNCFWKALQYQYIGTDKFSNIYITCPTFDGKYACFDIDNLASEKSGITIFEVSKPNCIPVYRRIDCSNTPITSKTPRQVHIISVTNKIDAEGTYLNEQE